MKNKKVISSIIVLLLIWGSISIVFAGVVTNNDDQTTSSDSSIIIDYDDSYVQVDNATFINNVTVDGVNVDSTVMSGWAGDPIYNNSNASLITALWMLNWNYSAPSLTLIRNSNNNSWAVTEANLQLAIWDLNGTGGVVYLPFCNISITSTILLPSNVKLIGMGIDKSILYQQDGANCSLIQNYHWTNGYSFPSEYDENIWIEGITFNGNDYGQDLWSKPSDYSQTLHAVRFMAVRNVIIKNCGFKDVMVDGVNVRHGSNVHVSYCWFDGIGMNYSDSKWPVEVTTRGVYFMYCDNSSFNYNHAKRLRCSAVAIEPGFGSGQTNNMENFQVIGNFIDGGWNGIWVEGWNSSDGGCIKSLIISKNVLSNITRPDGYLITNIGGMNGIACVRYVYDYTISDNIINKAGNVTHPTYGCGIWANGADGIICNNNMNEIYGIGIKCEGRNIIFANEISNCTDYGIEMTIPSTNPYVFSPMIDNNRINDSKGGIRTDYASPAQWAKDVLGGSISDNIILNCDNSTEWINGIYNRYWNMTIMGNEISGGYDGILNRGSYCDLSHNKISLNGRAGIRFYNTGASLIKNIVCFNTILNVGDGDDDCIQLYDTYNSTFIGNIGEGNSDGIDHSGTCGYNFYSGNNMDCDDDDYDINSVTYKPTGQTNFTNFNFGTPVWP